MYALATHTLSLREHVLVYCELQRACGCILSLYMCSQVLRIPETLYTCTYVQTHTYSFISMYVVPLHRYKLTHTYTHTHTHMYVLFYEYVRSASPSRSVAFPRAAAPAIASKNESYISPMSSRSQPCCFLYVHMRVCS
jgi:hypothetical protein